jgi:hypothetical protein
VIIADDCKRTEATAKQEATRRAQQDTECGAIMMAPKADTVLKRKGPRKAAAPALRFAMLWCYERGDALENRVLKQRGGLNHVKVFKVFKVWGAPL